MGYVNPVTIWHKPSGEDWENVTNYTLKDGFPDGFSETLKGDGLNEYQVKEFTFNLHKPSLSKVPSRLDFCRIEEAGSGTVLLNGFIDEIRKEFTDAPEYTVFPNALLLKDTLVGEETEDVGEDPITELKVMGTPKPLVDIVNEVADSVNTKRGTNFYADSDSVPTTESDKRSFFGNTLLRFRRLDFFYKLLKFVFTAYPGDGMTIKRKTDGSKPTGKAYYVVEKDAGFFMKTFISEGAFLSFSWGFSIGTPINRSWGFSFKVPWFDFRVPTLGAYYYVREAIGGGLTDIIDTREFFPLGPFYDSYPSLNEYGSNYTANQSQNITAGNINGYLKNEEGKELTGNNVVCRWDYDTNNTYVVVHTRPIKNDLSLHELLLSFETPFDNEYKLHYRNKNGSDVLKQLALVSNRWFYVDATDKIHFLPRNDVITAHQTSTADLLEFDKKTEKEPEIKIDVDRYKQNNDGKVETYGIVLRKNELDAIKNQYTKFAEGTREEYNIKLYNPPTGDNRIKLMDEIVVTDMAEGYETEQPVSVGRVTDLKQSFLEPWIEIKTEVSSNFELENFGGTQEEGEGPDPYDIQIVLNSPESNAVFDWEVGSLGILWTYTGDTDDMAVQNLNVWLQQDQGEGYENAVLMTQTNTNSTAFHIDLDNNMFSNLFNSNYTDYKVVVQMPELGIEGFKYISIFGTEF